MSMVNPTLYDIVEAAADIVIRDLLEANDIAGRGCMMVPMGAVWHKTLGGSPPREVYSPRLVVMHWGRVQKELRYLTEQAAKGWRLAGGVTQDT